LHAGNKPDLTERIDSLKQEIDEIQAQARALVIKQARSHTALASIYDDELQNIGERLDILKHTLAQTERELQTQDTSAAKAAFRELPDEGSGFVDMGRNNNQPTSSSSYGTAEIGHQRRADREYTGCTTASGEERSQAYLLRKKPKLGNVAPH